MLAGCRKVLSLQMVAERAGEAYAARSEDERRDAEQQLADFLAPDDDDESDDDSAASVDGAKRFLSTFAFSCFSGVCSVNRHQTPASLFKSTVASHLQHFIVCVLHCVKQSWSGQRRNSLT